MRNIVIYTNMAPSPEIDYAGVFVKNQFEYLRTFDKDNSYHLYAMPKTFTGVVGSVKKYLSFSFSSFKYLTEKNVDIIHLHYFFPLAILPWLAKKRNGAKIVVTVHGSDFYAKMNNWITRSLFKRILKDYDQIICVGEELAFDFEQKMKLKVDQVLCAGVDRQLFKKIEGVPKKYDFLFVGTLTERKGIDIVVKMIENTADIYRWCIVGSGSYSNRIEDLITRFPSKVTYHQKLNQSELNILYNESKWFFFPSRNEPFGLVASESIFSGTPVISSASGGLKEQVKTGFNGFILEDPEEIESNLKLLSTAYNLDDEKYKEMVSNCTENSVFSLDYVCQHLSHTYKAL